jgi:hypothetical protein
MRLPVEVLHDIASLAIALGIISIKDATLACPRWKLRYQQLLFKSPFSSDIPDLEKRAHLAPYIEVLHVAHRSSSSTPSDYKRDLTESFTKLLPFAHLFHPGCFCTAHLLPLTSPSIMLGPSCHHWNQQSSYPINAPSRAWCSLVIPLSGKWLYSAVITEIWQWTCFEMLSMLFWSMWKLTSGEDLPSLNMLKT